MGETGRKRLGTSDEFVATLDSQVAHPTFNDAEAETNNEFVERLEDNDVPRRGSKVGINGGVPALRKT